MFSLSNQERSLLMGVFPQFLDALERQGAGSRELQALLEILQTLQASDGTDDILEKLLLRATNLLETVMPDPLTLEEASDFYGVKADTLRRACWSGKLPAKMRGKTWFVNNADIEHYLATSKRKRTRRSP